MSEIVLNYTGLDNVPGKIVFNKSSDYFEWLNRGKPKNVETLDVEIDEVKANGTYIKVPEKEGGYFDKVVMNVNVPRRAQPTGIGFSLMTASTTYSTYFNFSNPEAINVSNIASAKDIMNEDIMKRYLIQDGELSGYLNLGLVTTQINKVVMNNGEMILVLDSVDDLIRLRIFTSAVSASLTLNEGAYIAVLKNSIETTTGYNFSFGFNSDANTRLLNIATQYGVLSKATVGFVELDCVKNSYNFSTTYEKLPSLQ